MELQQIPLIDNNLDILALVEREEIIQEYIDPLGQVTNISVEAPIETIQTNFCRESLLTRFRRASVPKIQFLFYYLSISTIVFVILLTSANWNSYYSVLSAYVNPQALTDSKNDIISVLDKSRVTVYAENTVDI